MSCHTDHPALALDLWREWLGQNGDPWTQDDYGRTWCFFCAGQEPQHEGDCVFVRARVFLEEQP